MQETTDEDFRRLEGELARCCGGFPEVLHLKVSGDVPMELQAQLPYLDFHYNKSMSGNPLMGKYFHLKGVFRHPQHMSRRVNFDLAAVTAYPKTFFACKTSAADSGSPLKLDVESGNASIESDFTSAVVIAAVMQALSTQDLVLLSAMLRRAAAALLSRGDSSTSCTTQSVWLLYSAGVYAEHTLAGGPTHNSIDYLKALGDFLLGRGFADAAAKAYRDRVKDLLHPSLLDPARHPLDHNMRTRFEAWSDLAAAQCLAGDMQEALKAHKAALREAEKVTPKTAESTQLQIRASFALASLPWEGAQGAVQKMVEEVVGAVQEVVPRAVFLKGKLQGGSPPPGHPLLKNTETIIVADAAGKQYAYNFMADFPGLAISAISDKDRINFEPIGHQQQLQQKLQQLQLLQEHQQLRQYQQQYQQQQQQQEQQQQQQQEESVSPWEKVLNNYRADQVMGESDYSIDYDIDYDYGLGSDIDYNYGLGSEYEDIAAATGLAPLSALSGGNVEQTAAEPPVELRQEQQQQQQQRKDQQKDANMAKEHLHLFKLQQQIQELHKKQQQGQRTPLGPAAGISSCRCCGASGPGTKLQRCSACSNVFYCSAACQKSDWKDHKPACKRAQKKVQEQPSAGGKGRAKQQGGKGKK